MRTSMGLVAPHMAPVAGMAGQVKGRRVAAKGLSAAGSTLFSGSRRLISVIALQRRDKAGRHKIGAVSVGEVSDQAEPIDNAKVTASLGTAEEPEPIDRSAQAGPIETEEATSSDVMFMTDDSSEIEKAIKKIEAENQALRERVALAKLETLAEPALEIEGRSVDVTRPRLGAVAPSLAGVQPPAPSTLTPKGAGRGSLHARAFTAFLQAALV